MKIASKSIPTLLSMLSLLVFGLTTPAIAATPKAGATCTKAGLTATASGKIFTCIKSGKKLVWDKGVTIPKPASTPVAPTPTTSPTPTPSPTPSPTQSATPTPSPSASATPSAAPSPSPSAADVVTPNGKCSKEGDIQPLNGGQMICSSAKWQPYAGSAPSGSGTSNNPSTTVVTPWGYLSVINSGNGLGNVSDAALVQTSTGDIRVYFKNGNDSGAKLTGFDNFVHSAISKDGGKTWTIESGVRMQVTSPVEVLPKAGGGFQAWGWGHSPGKDYMYYAESSDGLTFTEISVPGLDVNKCLTTTGVAFGPLGDPAIVKLADGTWLLHAQGFGVGNTGPNYARWACVATSPDGKTWTPVQSRSYGGTIDVETNPNIYLNKDGKVEWMWPGGRGVETKIGDGTTYGEAISYPKAGDPERLDLADGTELFAMGGFDDRGGGAIIFAKRVTNSYVITPTPGAPTGGSPNRLLTWTVKGASAGDISVMNFCLNKKVTEISGATVTITTSNGVVTVVSADPANDHACVYLQVGPEKIIG